MPRPSSAERSSGATPDASSSDPSAGAPSGPAADRRSVAADELRSVGRAAGLDLVGLTGAEPLERTRRALEERRAAGLHGGMQFTYRNPARSTDPSATLAGARTVVVGARRYAEVGRTTEDPPPGGPWGRVARYARLDHYADLRVALGAVADHLRAAGWRAVVVADDNALVDRAVAHRAGLGWSGKSTNLLAPGAGSWFVLGSVITDAPIGVDQLDRPVDDGCGPCRRCLDGCPTGAIVAPGVLDARRCLAWLVQAEGVFPVEHRTALGDRVYGCDDCQEVCPPNRVATSGREASRRDVPVEIAGARGGPIGPWLDVVALLALADDDLLDAVDRWYVARRDPQHLRRNLLVVLGNVGDGDDAEVIGALGQALADPRPLVRAHAVWAARRLGRDDLVAAVGEPADEVADPDGLVRAELARAVPRRAAAGARP
ncbi:MAG: tRNA epoxyqueuosine(34) reductase QueG [Acidimicrobiales bacterium]